MGVADHDRTHEQRVVRHLPSEAGADCQQQRGPLHQGKRGPLGCPPWPCIFLSVTVLVLCYFWFLVPCFTVLPCLLLRGHLDLEVGLCMTCHPAYSLQGVSRGYLLLRAGTEYPQVEVKGVVICRVRGRVCLCGPLALGKVSH